jgi:hypothetical protein
MCFVTARWRPCGWNQFVRRKKRITEEALQIDTRGLIRWAGIDAARNGELDVKLVSIRLVGHHFLLLDLAMRRRAFNFGFDLGPYILNQLDDRVARAGPLSARANTR